MKKILFLSTLAAMFLVGCGEGGNARDYILNKTDLPKSILENPSFAKCHQLIKDTLEQSSKEELQEMEAEFKAASKEDRKMAKITSYEACLQLQGTLNDFENLKNLLK